jgi:hypothetical protein
MFRLIKTVFFGVISPVVLLASVAFAEEVPQPSTQPESGLASPNQEGVPLSLNRHQLLSRKFLDKKYTDEWMKLKEGESRILSDFNQVEKLYGTSKAKGISNYTDFSRQVFVVVVSELLDSCKRAGVTGLERIRDTHLKVTVQTLLDKDCQSVPGEERYQIIGMPVERPVESIEVVYTFKMTE